VEFRVLGPLEVRDNGRTLELGGAKQRAVLALLLLHPNEVISLDRLIDTIWGERAPETAPAAVHGSISRLRKTLEPDGAPYRVLQTKAPGYLFAGGAENVDRHRFERLATEGRAALAEGDAGRASELLSKALGLWRGSVLADVANAIADRTELDRLEEERLTVLEERVAADLALGRHAELVPELEALVARAPVRERLRGPLMLALYGTGRQADALAVYREGRAILDETLGIAPSNELRELERRILQQDPAISVERRPPPFSVPARADRARLAILIGIAVALAVAAAAVSFALRRDERPSLARVVSNGLGAIDPESNRLVLSIPVGNYPVDVAIDDDAIWVANAGDHTVARVDPQTRRVTTTKGLMGAPVRLNVSRDTVWIAMSHHDQPTSLVVLGSKPNESAEHVVELTPQRGLLFPVLADGPSGLWASLTAFRLSDEGALLAEPDTFLIPPAGNGLRFDVLPRSCTPVGGAIVDATVWIGCREGRIVRIDETTRRRATTTRVGSYLSALAVGEGAVWATDVEEDVVWRVDTATGRAARRIPVGKDPSAVAAGFGSVWVANTASGTVSRIDPETNRVVATIRVGRGASAIAVGRDRTWVTVAPYGESVPP
jgi:YVTN family beta-propeller protein